MISSSKPVVVVVGSLHYDIMVDAPDRPRKGETVTGYAWRPKFGGKGGNQAVAAAKAGAEVRMAGAVGADEFGRFLLDGLSAGGVDASRVARLPEAGSGMSVAIADASGDYGAVIVSGTNLLVDPAALAEPRLWQGASALILQNEMPEATNLAAARAARAVGATVCLNAAPYRPLIGRVRPADRRARRQRDRGRAAGRPRRDRSRLGGCGSRAACRPVSSRRRHGWR